MRALFLIFATVTFLSCSKKKEATAGGCALGTSVVKPSPAFSTPVWHPDGATIGFNHLPITGIRFSECSGDYYSIDADSVGFYLIGKDGKNYRRMTDKPLYTPRWSPDGTKLAYASGRGIYVVNYDGNKLDTANAKRISDISMDAYPSWTTNSDSVYYSSITLAGVNGVQWVKIAADGTGKTVQFTEYLDQPFLGTDNRIYFLYNNKNIGSMNLQGEDKKVLGSGAAPSTPQYFDGKVYFQDADKLTYINAVSPLESNVFGFDISKNGEIVYSNFVRRVLKDEKQNGTLWIMNTDGSAKHQLTFNNY